MEKLLLRVTFSACVLFGGYLMNSNTGGGFTADLTGSPLSSSTCQTGCHSSFPLNSGPGSVSMNIPSTYYPGNTYNVSMSVNQAVPKFGFMAGVLRDNNTNGGTFSSGSGSSATTISGNSYIRHNSFNSSGTWNFTWTAPSYSDTITFYYVGNAASNSAGNQQDYIYTSSSTTLPLSQITFDIDTNNVACSGICNGSVVVNNVSGGAGGPYTYAWNNGGTINSISGLCAGTYTVTVTDNDGNSEDATIVVGNNGAEITTQSVIVDENCGQTNGSILVSAQGGTLPYTYSWSNGGTTNNIDNLSAGIYTLTITDANGCFTLVVDTVASSEAVIDQTATIVQNLSCNGDSSGSIDVVMASGSAPFSFVWSSGETTASISSLSAGEYTVTVTDGVGCEAIESYEVTEPEVLTATLSVTEPSSGNCDGVITVIADGGTAPFDFAWSHNGMAVGDNQSALCPGDYNIIITDGNGCTFEIDTLLEDVLSFGFYVDEPQFEFFPNPAKDRVFIYSSLEINEIEIRDMSGRTVLNQRINQPESIDVSQLKNGNYVMLVRGNGTLIRRSLVIHR